MIHSLENLGATDFSAQVSAETMRKAVRLSTFYCSQFLLLQSKSAQQQPLEGLLLDILKFIRQSGGQISTRDLCRSRFQTVVVEGKKLTSSTAGKLLKEIASAGFGTFEEVRNKKIFTLNEQLSSTVMNCHKVYDSSKHSNSKALTESCHKMTKVYVSEKFDSHTEPPSEHLIDAPVSDFAEIPKNLEDIQVCHFMTVESESQSLRELKAYDSSMTVHDSYDSSTLNEDETELLEMLHTALKEGDPVLAKNVRGSLKQVCEAGHADRKKVWGALSGEEQKVFTRKMASGTPNAADLIKGSGI